jgi:hypothetical protein
MTASLFSLTLDYDDGLEVNLSNTSKTNLGPAAPPPASQKGTSVVLVLLVWRNGVGDFGVLGKIDLRLSRAYIFFGEELLKSKGLRAKHWDE